MARILPPSDTPGWSIPTAENTPDDEGNPLDDDSPSGDEDKHASTTTPEKVAVGRDPSCCPSTMVVYLPFVFSSAIDVADARSALSRQASELELDAPAQPELT